MEEKTFVISVLVDNRFGVLTRIAGLFARRGYNIDSLTVSATQEPETSRMTIVVRGDKYVEDQILKQLEKQVDVKCVQRLSDETMVLRELVLVKLRAGRAQRREILRLCSNFRADVVDIGDDSLILQLTDESAILDEFVEKARPFGIIELCRTGLTALERGSDSIFDHREFHQEGGARR